MGPGDQDSQGSSQNPVNKHHVVWRFGVFSTEIQPWGVVYNKVYVKRLSAVVQSLNFSHYIFERKR